MLTPRIRSLWPSRERCPVAVGVIQFAERGIGELNAERSVTVVSRQREGLELCLGRVRQEQTKEQER
jgi:hypothetical protein